MMNEDMIMVGRIRPMQIVMAGRIKMGIFTRLRSLFGNTAAASPPEPEQVAQETSATEQPAIANERRATQRIDARKGTRALIIDDSATVVAALGKILRSAGYLTLEALDAETGVVMARTEQPDIIFLDIVLPGMNGFEALRLMRRDPQTTTIPIVMISGNEAATEQFYANRIGADDFMKKPFSRYEVFSRIERLLDSELIPRRKSSEKASQPQ